MSQRNKLSLWQKIKRLLTAAAPQSVIDGASEQGHASLTDSEVNNTKNISADISHELEAKQGNEQDNTQAQANTSQLKTDNLKTDSASAESQNQSDTPIVDCLKQYFNDKQWHYTHYRPKTNDSQKSHHLSLRMRHKQINCGYLFRVQEKNKLLAIYGILPFLIPETYQSAAMLLITQINYDMLVGNLEMDVNDGEIRYKNAIDVEAVGIDNEIIEHLLQSVVAMTTVANELFGNLVNNQDPAEDMQTLLVELRQQSDARTFFLPTQFVQ
ncbi:YbjN domain-containing protein [Psychrobacter sp. BI730]|uniref:YbjN domain-containing protein n=1 Tax=Psychrobacter sp. BI730 TaxID=2705463 RepID=UPI0015C928D3|nr:YbjN domain-containing protein [Psychrobacter sp. BI730]NYR10280.1 YbjN domain-containing protein [Psychrobacter sp. BI730]